MLNITPIPALADNYIWAIQSREHGDKLVIVDPSEAEPVFDFIAKNPSKLTAILLTHNHHDHIGGVNALKAKYPDVVVYGSAECEEWATILVEPEQHFELFGYDVRVMASAGHTAQHVSYLFGNEYLFCGDSLFSGGCGRVFTGDYQAQFDALLRFKALPEFVEIYAGHEYTQSNLKFAEAVLPPSCALAEYQEQVDMLRAKNQPTLPTHLARELLVNPFLQAENLDEFIALRQKKDNF